MSFVHQNQYEQAVDLLEEIVCADPTFDYQHEEDFVESIADSSRASFTPAELSRIKRLHKKYVLSQASEESDEND